jgi:hypothetical protein
MQQAEDKNKAFEYEANCVYNVARLEAPHVLDFTNAGIYNGIVAVALIVAACYGSRAFGVQIAGGNTK